MMTGQAIAPARETAARARENSEYVRSRSKPDSLSSPLRSNRLYRSSCETVELDVSDDASVEAGVKNVLAKAGKIDVLVNNAGIASAGVTEAFTTEQAKAIFDTNVIGLLRVTRAVLQDAGPKLTLVKMKCTVAFMKHYGQACAIARALDVVGERWSLLLVRELTFGPRRYRDLATGLPGIPSNVLAARLKDLQAAGVVTRRTLPAPTDVTVYELTGAGRALQPALSELLDWGLRYAPEPSADDASQPGWPLLAAAGRPTALPAGQVCELRVGPEFFYLGSDAGTLTVRRGPAPGGDAVVTMSAGTFYSLLTGQMTVTDVVRHSTVDGDTEIARRALEPLAAAGSRPAM